MEPAVAKVALKKARTVDLTDCFLCQRVTTEKLVLNPSTQSCDTLSQALNTLLHCESTGTLLVPSVIGVNCTEQVLQELDVRWHLPCYKRYTLKKTLESEQKRFEEQTQPPTSEDQPSSSSKEYFTRSNSTIYR